jgi:hypothetical protein
LFDQKQVVSGLCGHGSVTGLYGGLDETYQHLTAFHFVMYDLYPYEKAFGDTFCKVSPKSC